MTLPPLWIVTKGLPAIAICLRSNLSKSTGTPGLLCWLRHSTLPTTGAQRCCAERFTEHLEHLNQSGIIWCNVNGPAGARTPRDPTQGGKSLSTEKSSAPAHPSTEDHDHQDESPHACLEGVVYIGHLVEDPGAGEEVEVIEA